MKRRTFVKSLMVPAVGAVTGFRLPLANAASYDGKLFVFVQADGGWDPTSFCDPKTNTPGEKIINHWAENAEIRQAGNLIYADFANNAAFFEKYYDRMLVINGVDAQTNSHSAGVVHNWSGRVSEGYPSMTALLATHYAPGLSLAYLSFGGFSNTASLTTYTRLSSADLIRNIAIPEVEEGNHLEPYFSQADWETLKTFRGTVSSGWPRRPISCPEPPTIADCMLRRSRRKQPRVWKRMPPSFPQKMSWSKRSRSENWKANCAVKRSSRSWLSRLGLRSVRISVSGWFRHARQ